MLYEDNLPLYVIMWQSRSFLNNFGFNCVSIFAIVSIFFVCLSVYLSNKKWYEDNQPLYEILWWIRFLPKTLSFDSVSIFANVNIFHMFTSAKT